MSLPVEMPCALGRPEQHSVIRAVPEDFVVDEVLGFDPSGDGEHIYLLLRKVGCNTAWVAEELARLAGLRHFDVGYAGRKDRHAVTTQWFSLWLPGQQETDWQTPSIEGVDIVGVTKHSRKLRRGMHQGNRFRIRLPDVVRTDDLCRRIEAIGRHGVPNYFGEQRFGRCGANLNKAELLLAGGLRKDRKRDLYLSAARSYLFNLALAGHVESGDWSAPDACGWLPGVVRGSGEPERVSGFDSWYEGLERLGVKAMRRPLAITPADWSAEWINGGVVLSFELPSGSYATSVVRELVHYVSGRSSDRRGAWRGETDG